MSRDLIVNNDKYSVKMSRDLIVNNNKIFS